MIHKEFLLEGKTLNNVLYAPMLMEVVEIDFERGQLLRETQFLYHNSVPAHSAIIVKHLMICFFFFFF